MEYSFANSRVIVISRILAHDTLPYLNPVIGVFTNQMPELARMIEESIETDFLAIKKNYSLENAALLFSSDSTFASVIEGEKVLFTYLTELFPLDYPLPPREATPSSN